MMKNNRIKEILDETFSDLKLFYRDTDLADDLIEKYKVGQIIKEKGFTDMTSIVGGLSGNCRYLIASANAKDLSKFNRDSAKIGHFLLDEIAFFKVLDIHKINNKTQVLLLHIPDNSLSLFKNSFITIEEEIKEKARQKFSFQINAPLVPELQTENWKEKTESPIGMNDRGEMFFDDSTIKVEKPLRIVVNKEKKSIEINKKPWWRIW
jgi:uncharacterized protein (UPF0297 family)